jgi:hypothetical protein
MKDVSQVLLFSPETFAQLYIYRNGTNSKKNNEA